MERIQLTLCIPHQHPQILLGMKKRGFGAGKWNGFGGKVHSDESIEDAAHREMHEECGIHAGSIEKAGELDFVYPDRIHETHIFRVTNFTGIEVETEEMRPKWFSVEDIPFTDMWPDDRYWFPLFLQNKTFRGEFIFGEGGEIERYTLQ